MNDYIEIPINPILMELEFDIDEGSGGKLPTYDGEYTITPKPFTEQVLETKNKSLVNDITVLEIPYSEVTNPEGGKTVNIAFKL